MNITLHNLGRRFNQEWIFKNIDYTFSSTHQYAILGPNGSGKSTLLKVIAGQLSPSSGSVTYTSDQGEHILVDNIYNYLTIAAPYIELIEEFTLNEMLDFHFKFKRYIPGADKVDILDFLGMKGAKDKMLKHFSSGMKQRVKLALACFSESNILFLDEPTSNFDTQGEQWYIELLAHTKLDHRLVIVGSNQEKEYTMCDKHLFLIDYK